MKKDGNIEILARLRGMPAQKGDSDMTDPTPRSDGKFTRGMIVRLKSNGPAMCVEEIREEGGIACSWFVDGELRRADFYYETLDLLGKLTP